MPDFSKMFAKRLSEDDYDQLKTYLDGKTTFNQVGSEAQNVLKAITKPENDRSFDEQEKLFEMKTKLIIDKYILDSSAWDQFEIVYRTFWLGAAARQKLFKLTDLESGVSPGGLTTKSARVDPSYNYNVEKWEKISMERFWDDKKNAPGFADEYRGLSLEESQIQYKKDFFQYLEDPNTKLELAEDYRKDFRLKPKDIELTEVKLESPPGFDKVLNRFMSEDMEALSFGVKGLRVSANKFTNWLKEQGEGGVEGIVLNLGVGIGIQKTLDFIARASHMTAHGERVMDFWVTESLAGLQLSMATSTVGVVIGVGILLAQPIIKLVEFLKSGSARRRKANDTPEKVYGTQFARVRSQDKNGVVTWYPGILASKDLWTGIGSKEQNIRINYGKLEDLYWRFNKNGTFSPYFKHPRYRMINAKDRDLKEYSSEEQRVKFDPLRDFSLFTLKDTDAMFSNLVQGKDLSDFKETVDDRSTLPKYLQELISYRDDFEWVRTFNTGDETIGRHLNPADRSIRREFEHSVLADPQYVKESGIYFEMMSDKHYKQGFAKYKGELHENKALLSFFHARMSDLLRSQKIAAEETPAFLESLKNIGRFDDRYNYTLYALDTGTQPANSLDELKKQVSQTQTRDLTWYEKNYLQQKQIVRYFAKKLSNRALGGDIVDAITYPWQNTYSADPKNENTALNYRGLLSAAGTFRLKQVGHTSVMGNPPGPWSDSNEKTIPKWLYDGKYMRRIRNTSKKEDYIEASEKLHTLMQDQFVGPGLRNVKFKPNQAFLDSNPFVLEIRKYKGDVGKKDEEHRYDRKGERVFEETAQEKLKRLKADKDEILKFGRQKDGLPYVPLGNHVIPSKLTSGDPTRRNDAFYVHNKDFKWSFEQKKFIPNKKNIKSVPKNVTWEQRFGKKLEGAQTKLFGHGTVGLDPKKTKLEKLGDDKGRDSRKKQLDQKRAWERLRASSEQARIHSDNFAKKRKHHGMNYYEYQEFIRDHGGKTPDEVYKQGAWKVAKNGGAKKQTTTTTIKTKQATTIKTTQATPIKTTVIPKQALPKPIQKTAQVSALQEYLRDQHGMMVSKDDINRSTLPFLAFDEKGRPALFGDPILHKKLGLADSYRVVTGSTGVIHKSYDPSKVQPKFFSQHETSVVEHY